jgi:hypothetical protein
MAKQTWGLQIPGYSSPSVAQQKRFAKMYPEELAWHQLDQELDERDRMIEQLRKKRLADNTQTAK